MNTLPHKGAFNGCSMYVVPSALGRNRLNLFQTQITKKGGRVAAKWDPSVTHVLVEDSVAADPESCSRVLARLGVSEGVRPVPLLWLSRCLKEDRLLCTAEYELAEPVKRKATDEADGAGTSRDSEVQLSPPKKLKDDSVQKFACSQASSRSEGPVVNEAITTELQKLADAFKNSRDHWRAHGYQKAISAIKAYGKQITSFEEAHSLPGVGAKMAVKVVEILESGRLRKVDEICNNEKTQVIDLFTKVWGAGPATADGWYQQGYRTLDDLKKKANLTKQQRIGLKHYDDIQARIPREEVKEIGDVVQRAVLALEPNLDVELCGSYRRGKPTCGDIDVLISKPDGLSANILPRLLASLKQTGFITDDLVSLEVNGNQKKYLGVCRLPGEDQRHRRLDIFVVPRSEFVSAMMHYTGSAMFNRSIRLLAIKKGMSLTEHGLFAGIVRQGKDVVSNGYVVPTPTEESVFRHLGLEYRPPEERDH